jgi:hypothetical membrane protein
MSTRFIRLAGLFGILAPTITLTLIFVSIALSPWFSWHDNALSDMGVGQTALLFNSALLFGGLMYLVFITGFLRWIGLKSALARIGAGFMLAGGIGLGLVGIFTEAAGRLHYAVAATYFLATPLAYVLLGSEWLRRSKRVPGFLSIAAGLAAFLMIAAVPHKRIAVPEILAAVIIGAWTFSIGLKMLIEPEALHEQTRQAI